MRLGNRLQAVADLVPRGAILADIGTDHAYLPIALVHCDGIAKAYACDVHQGPYEAACRTVQSYGLAERVITRLGDGLAAIAPGEADTAVMAGMGGATMVGILERAPKITAQLECLILQPMNAAPALRRWLCANGWNIVDEALAKEDARMYEIIKVRRGQSEPLTDWLCEVGPRLWEKRDALLEEHLQTIVAQYRRIFVSMSSSKGAEQTEKYRKIAAIIQTLEGKLQCL